MNRSQRRHIEHQLRKLFRSKSCSICGGAFMHNSRTAGGLDAQGIVLAGECCISQVAAIFTLGFYSDHQFDFPWPCNAGADGKPSSGAGIAEAIGLFQNVISETDELFEDMMRHGGGMPVTPRLNLLDSAWKDDDRLWFERNPKRSHRVRMPFPGEADKFAAPPGYVLMILLRQVDPGTRARAAVHINVDLLPLPDHEAAAHALFEAAAGREALQPDRQALDALIEKYTLEGTSNNCR